MCKVENGFFTVGYDFSSYQPNAILFWGFFCYVFFFTFSYVVRNLKFILISRLFLLICHDILVLSERKRKCRLVRFLTEMCEFSVTYTVGSHLPFQPGYIIYYLVKASPCHPTPIPEQG